MTLTPERRAEIENHLDGLAASKRSGLYMGRSEEMALDLLAALAEAERERDYWRERAVDRWEAAQRREIAEREAEGEEIT